MDRVGDDFDLFLDGVAIERAVGCVAPAVVIKTLQLAKQLSERYVVVVSHIFC